VWIIPDPVPSHGIYFAWARSKGKPISPRFTTLFDCAIRFTTGSFIGYKLPMKCPAAGCESTMMHKTIVDGLPMLTCTHGHVICVDSSTQLATFARQLTSIVTALATHLQAVEKNLAELKKTVEDLSLPKP
jgi:hypothetical protein